MKSKPIRRTRKKLRQRDILEGHQSGISGETSSGTLSRIKLGDEAQAGHRILETGANDGLRGIDPAVTRINIDKTISILNNRT